MGYWDDRARMMGSRPAATGWGGYLRELELLTLREQLKEIASPVLDLGCGNGYLLGSLTRMSGGKVRIVGMDRSTQMLSVARGHGRFLVCGDAVRLPFKAGAFASAYSVRTLINMGSREKQARALGEVARVLKQGGKLTLIECFEKPFGRLNAMRRRLGLPDLPSPRYNIFLQRPVVLKTMGDDGLQLVGSWSFPLSTAIDKLILSKLEARRTPGFGRRFLVTLRPFERPASRLLGDLGHDAVMVGRKSLQPVDPDGCAQTTQYLSSTVPRSA